MRFLLDTHILLWALGAPSRLSQATIALLGDSQNELLFSPANLWEIAIKRGGRKAYFNIDPRLIHSTLREYGYTELPIRSEHAIAVGDLPAIHKDPFDRILVAQARVEGITLLTSDPVVARYPGPIRRV
jgi:PIN domain nuclease of toxin-antitoxin system